MAEATAILTVTGYPTGTDNTQKRQILYGTCALSSGGDYATNGIPLPWSAMVDGNAGGLFVADNGPQTTQPQDAFFFSTTGSVFYSYKYDKVNNTLRIASGATELTNGAAITADTIEFNAEFVRGV